MAIDAKDTRELDQIHSDYGKKFGGVKNDYFALLHLKRKFKSEPETVAHQVAFGNNDYGIDAYYIDTAARNLYLFQFKWSESADQFKSSMDRLAQDGLARIFGNPLQDPNQNEFLMHLKRDIQEYKNAIESVYIQFVFKGDIEATERSDGLQSRTEDIENKLHLIEAFFGREVKLRIDFVSDKPSLLKPPPGHTYPIAFDSSIEVSDGEHRMLIGFVKLMDLYRIYVALGQRFFDRNIRAALSADLPPNKRIRQALNQIVLQGNENPALFTFRHNGVALAAEGVSVKEGVAILHVPRLLNGAQTVSSLAKFISDSADHPGLTAGRERLEQIKVLAKIVEADPGSNFVVDLTIATNQQNPVLPWTLRAMDRRQVDLADRFREEVKIFYSRQEGAFANLSEDEKEDLGIEEVRDIRIRQLAQALLAAQGEIDKMSRLPDVFENQALYEATFNKKYTTQATDIRDLVLAYKVGLVLNTPVRALQDKMPTKHSIAVRRAKNLVWALLIQGILNDPKLQNDREDYGESLAKSWTFKERLESIAKKNISTILKDLFQIPLYAERLQQEKYEFLRTKEVYKKAMEIAYDRYGWKKRQV